MSTSKGFTMLDDLLGSATRARVLEALLAPPRRPLHLRELIRRCGTGSSGVQREVERLERIGLARSEVDETGRRLVSVVPGHPLIGGAGAARERLAGAGGRAERPGSHPSAPARPPAAHRRGVSPRRGRTGRAVRLGDGGRRSRGARKDLDVVVRLGGPVEGRAARYFTLRLELAEASGLSVDLVEEEALSNPYLREEVARYRSGGR